MEKVISTIISALIMLAISVSIETAIMMELLAALHHYMWYIPAIGFKGSIWIAVLFSSFIWISNTDLSSKD